MYLMMRAGTPPTTAPGGTSFVTTAPAATTRYSAVVLEVAAGVDKHVVAHGDVLTEIRVEGREYT